LGISGEKMKIHKTLLLKIYEPNKAKREYLDNIIKLYAKTLNFYLEAIKNLGMFYIASLDKKEALTYLEYQTIKTSTHPNPKYPIFDGVQTNIRRSAINKAVGMVKSYLSNLYNWHKNGKDLEHNKPSYPNPKNYTLTYYATDVDFKDILIPRNSKELPSVRIKVLDENNQYKMVNYPVLPYKRFYQRLNDFVEKGWSLKNTATLIKRDNEFYIAILLEKEAKKPKIKKPKYTINVDLNIQRNLATISVNEIDWKNKENKLRGITFINGDITKLTYKRDYLLHLIRIKQRLTGRKPNKEDNKYLWRKINNLNREIALKVAKEIDKIVDSEEWIVDSLGSDSRKVDSDSGIVVVFEKLKGLRANKNKSKKLNRKLNYWLKSRIIDKVKEKGLEKGYKVDDIYPQYTSQRCSKCGTIGERFSPNGSTALFRCQCCGYIVNADVNAVFNQFFIYLSYLLKAGREDGSVVPLGISLKSSSKRRKQSKGSSRKSAVVNV